MKKLVCITTLKKYLVVICFVISVILIVIASRVYPGGSFIDKNAIGFNWLQNFMSNLFTSKALNGSENSGWILALIGMAFHSVAYGIFFINMSKKNCFKTLDSYFKIYRHRQHDLNFFNCHALTRPGCFFNYFNFIGFIYNYNIYLKIKTSCI